MPWPPKTIEVTRKSDGARCVINEADFDERFTRGAVKKAKKKTTKKKATKKR
jgi:hypothetical protein